MNILQKNIDACNAILTLEISKEDYASQVEKVIKDYAKKANIPGFRVGMVPKGLINKMYGKTILLEEVNKLVSNSLFDYLKENNISILGEPISNETEQKPLNLETDENFEFKFDIALAPEINVEFTKKDKIPFYSIKITDEMVESKVKMYRSQFGTYVQQPEVLESDLLKGDLLEIKQEGKPLEVLDAMLTLKYMKDDAQKALFLGKKAGDAVTFNPVAAFENEYEISSLLSIAKDKIRDFNHDFEYKIKEITRHQECGLNQELFDKVLGKDIATDEKTFREKLSEIIASHYLPDCEYKFMLDIKALALQKIENVAFPEEFLKRWLKTSQKDMTEEKLEKDFPAMLDYLKWDLIIKSIAKANSVEIGEEQVFEAAKADAAMRFAQYGMASVPSDVLDNYATEMLKKEEAKEKYYRHAFESVILAIVKEQITVSKKTVTVEEFNKLIQ